MRLELMSLLSQLSCYGTRNISSRPSASLSLGTRLHPFFGWMWNKRPQEQAILRLGLPVPRINIFVFPLNIGKLTVRKKYLFQPGFPCPQPYSAISGQMRIGCIGERFGVEI